MEAAATIDDALAAPDGAFDCVVTGAENGDGVLAAIADSRGRRGSLFREPPVRSTLTGTP